jgi:predicted phosphodiesterase
LSVPIAILTSDWHIAEGAWKHRDIKGDAYHSLEQIVFYATQHDLPILAAGDLYDTSDPDPGSVAFVRRQLDQLEAGGLHLYYTEGQHEHHRSGGSWLGVHHWPIHLRRNYALVDKRLSVYGFDWTPAQHLPAAIAEIPADVDLIMCHQVWSEFKVSGSNAEGKLADIPGGALILTGDYHVTKILTAGAHTVLSPGSIAIQSIDEDPNKFFFVLHDDMTLHPVQLKTRKVAHFQVMSQGDLDQFLVDQPWLSLLESPDLPPNLQKPLVSVTFDAEIPLVVRRLTDALGSVVHYFPSPLFNKRLVDGMGGEASVVFYRGLLDALEHEVPVDSPEYAPLRRLLSAKPDSLAEELASIKREFFECQRAPRPASPA